MWSRKDVFALVLCEMFFQVSLLFCCVIWIPLSASPQPLVIRFHSHNPQITRREVPGLHSHLAAAPLTCGRENNGNIIYTFKLLRIRVSSLPFLPSLLFDLFLPDSCGSGAGRVQAG